MKFTPHSGCKGMSLVEILMAMAILTVGATSLIALFASASSTHKRAVDRTHAALVAEEVFSEVQARYFVGTKPKDILTRIRDSLSEKIDGYYWDVYLHRPGAPRGQSSESYDESWSENELVVRVVVRWSRATESHEEVYSTILLPRHRRSIR